MSPTGRRWVPIELMPPYKTFLLYRKGDLYPVVGWKMQEGDETAIYMLEEGGPEDGEHRVYPIMRYAPTHYAELPETPGD